MISLFQNFGLELSNDKCLLFDKYFELLIEWNKKINLTSITERNEVITKHFIDSVLLLSHYSENYFENKEVIDIGTGAGFPGIPLAIMMPNTNFTLIDSLNKRIHFLEIVIDELQLKNVRLFHGRAEDYGKDNDFREQFDFCVSRAVAPLPTLLEFCSPFIKVDGNLLLYKSKKSEDEIREAKHALSKLNCTISDICELWKDKSIERYILNIKKDNQTPDKYPRRAGKPKKKPL